MGYFGMKCPLCGNGDTGVVDSRLTGDSVWRRRECPKCKRRFTTYERAELEIFVVKKDGRREPYKKEKLMTGILKATEKRPIPVEKINELVEGLEQQIRGRGKLEISSSYIGDLVMKRLKRLDEVAYIRFASVYRQFKDVRSFQEELRRLKKG